MKDFTPTTVKAVYFMVFLRFRAFFLYHYWPCRGLSERLFIHRGDKSIFQMYMHEPIDICVLSGLVDA